MIVVMLVWWNIWKVRNATIFQGIKFNHNLVLSLVKKKTLLTCTNHDLLSWKEANWWYIDLIAILESFSASKRLYFMKNLCKELDLVGFGDGAWNSSEGKGGLGGVLFSKDSTILSACSGPVSDTSALGDEVDAYKYMWHIMGE